MFEKLFGSKKPALPDADAVWLSNAARLKGIRHDVSVLVEDDNSIVVVALTMTAADDITNALAEFNPARCMSMVDEGTLRAQLKKRGAVSIAMPGALVSQGRPGSEVPLEILVYGRDDRRSTDDDIVRAAASLAVTSHVTFHLSMDDALLREHAASVKPMLEKLGMKEDEPVEHAFLSRVIRNAQKA